MKGAPGHEIRRAASDARRGVLQSQSAWPVVAENGSETSKIEISAGGRRSRPLLLLLKQKCIAKKAPIPASCQMPFLRSSPKTTRSLRICSALPFIRSTSSAPSLLCGRRVRTMKRSQPASPSDGGGRTTPATPRRGPCPARPLCRG